MATSFTVNVDDLMHILRQIKIAEAHSSGVPLVQAIQNEYGVSASDANLVPFGLRTVDGTLNNLAPGNQNFGAADQPFPRMLDPLYVNNTGTSSIDLNGPAPGGVLTNGNYALPGNVVDSSPRTITNLIANQTIDNPAAVEAWFNNPLSLAAFQDRYGPDAIPVMPGSLTGQVIAIANANFDLQSLPDGTFNNVAPLGWTITGITGGTIDPLNTEINPAGHGGENAVWLQTGAKLSRVIGETLSQGARYELSLNIGDRGDVPWAGGTARILATNGVDTIVLNTLTLTDPGNGEWSNVVIESGAIPPAAAGYSLMIEVESNTTPFGHLLIDDVQLVRFNANEFEIDNIDIANIPNQSPDIGLSPGFNSWMTFFGQFFDHGLDLVTKANNGTVFIPLQPDDPLITHGPDGIPNSGDEVPPHLAFMAVTRAQVDANGNAENTTTPFVDQNQTYTSHPSHQVFLREFVRIDIADGRGMVTRSTGDLLDGTTNSGSFNGAVANWGEVKAQALTLLGIKLSDFDVHDVPLLATDAYGEFIPGANGYAQLVMMPDADHPQPWLLEGNPDGSVTTAGAFKTGHAFLNDIAHHAAPGMYDSNGDHIPDAMQVADSDPGVGDDHDASTYDDEMLNAHFVTGDGRGNENIALTAVHSVFHNEHNRLVETYKDTIIGTAAGGDLSFLNEWLLVDVTSVPADHSTLVWDGERLFQAGRFVTEMQYQHLVFEEFARRIQPAVDPFVFTHSPDVDASIVAEFAHTVYRFGHSMLNDTVDRLDNNLQLLPGETDQATLVEAFLNPQMFVASGANLGEAIANIVRGATLDVGNAMDEFVVPQLQNNLLGLPLDLGAINIARARENGIPSLNEARKQFYADYGLADLKPYTSWIDFAQHIKNPASIVNFIAAYGTHPTIELDATLAGKRAAAMQLLSDYGNAGAAGHADAVAFLTATGAYADIANGGTSNALGGMNNIDFWIGGLAEQIKEFGGMLGSTFNLVFEFQMERLQTGDRFYYLSRTQGTQLLNQLEPNTFTDLVMRNTALGDKYATHLNPALFVTPDHIFELDAAIAQTDYNADNTASQANGGFDPVHDNAFLQLINPRVVRITGTLNGDGHYEGGTLKYSGGEHVVLGGTEGNDILISDKGIDGIWGDGGNDYINAGMESDNVFGGEGDDIIEDPFGDDVLRGDAGNDVISAGSGLDLVFGGAGNDYIIGGQDNKDIAGDEGDDFILGGTGNEGILGNEGNDWIEGGAGFDVISGDNSQLFFNSTIIGHDVAWGQGNDQDYDLESGDDIALSGPGIQRFEGMFGFDWASGKYDVAGVDFDFQIPIFTTITADILRDRFDQIEAGSGWKYADTLQGDDRGHVNGGSSAPDSVPVSLFTDHILTAEGIDRIDGLRDLLGGNTAGGGLVAMHSIYGTQTTSFRNGNILIGGGGSDILRGRGGYDILDGDAWLNVRIKIVHNGVTYSVESMNTDPTVAGELSGLVFNTDANGKPIFYTDNGSGGQVLSPAFGGRSLNSLMLDGTINPGSLSIVREILHADPSDGIDTAVFQGTLAEYDIEGRGMYQGQFYEARDVDGDGFIKVRDMDTGSVGAVVNNVQLTSRGALTDDIDLLRNIEVLQFADQSIVISGGNQLASGLVTILDDTPFGGLVTPYVGQVLTATLTNVTDGNGIAVDANGTPTGPYTFEWQTTEVGSNAGWTTIQTSDTYTVRSVDPGHILRAVAVFEDSQGNPERISSAATDNPTAAYLVRENTLGIADGAAIADAVVGLTIPFSVDYDAQPINGQPPADVDITTLYHEIDPANNANGRFTVVRNPVDTIEGFPRYSIVVNHGGPTLLNYEAPQHTPANQSYQFVDNQYQVVVNTYSDSPANGGTLIAVRQFTILLENVEPELIDIAPVLDLNADGNVVSSQLFSENFDSNSYTVDDGLWTQNWVETGDDDSSTSDNGQIRINGGALEFDNGSNGANSNGASITRAIDLSGADSATLSFSYNEQGFDTGDNETVLVQFAADGVNFTTVQTIDGNSGSGTTNDLALTGPFSANSAIRFVVSAVNGNNDLVSIDNIVITKNTSAFVAGTAGTGHSATFTENGATVAISSKAAVTDVDTSFVMGATVKLTNAQAQDQLSIAGTLPAGITTTFGPAIAGEITLYLVGPTTMVDMQAAINHVRFQNTGDNPTDITRTIHVTVNDGEKESNIAVATINVETVDDPVDAINDAIVTNIALGGQIVVPKWVLLANDIDPDSVIDITAVSGANGIGSLSLATNPGSVTFVDTSPANGSFAYTASGGPATDNATVNVSTMIAPPTVIAADDFNSSVHDNTDGTPNWAGSWSETGDTTTGNVVTGGQIQLDNGTNQLRFVNGDGATITRGVNLAGVATAIMSFDVDQNGLDAGETVRVEFDANGDGTFESLLYPIDSGSSSNGATTTVNLVGGTANSAIRFVASAINGNGEDVRIDNLSISIPNTAPANIDAGNGNQILVGDSNATTFDGGTGNDIVLAGDGDDSIIWNANNGATDGRDIVDGGLGTDTVIINGNGANEDFIIYSRANALAAGITGLNALSEIIITRNGTVINELLGVEELVINTGAGNDTVVINGDFNPSALLTSTIRINDGGGDDMVDLSGLTSQHRVVFNGNGGNDGYYGAQRGQDEFDDSVTWRGAMQTLAPGGDPQPDDNGVDYDDLPEIYGTERKDKIVGTDVSEKIEGGSGADRLYGNGGNDHIKGGAHGDRIWGDDGIDRIEGEHGNDVAYGGEGDDTFVALIGDGNDRYYGDGGSDTIDMSAIHANISANLINGRVSSFESGRDMLSSIENVITGSGHDTIVANNSVNVMDGGDGNDLFKFNSVAAADGDVIVNFQPGDKIDLSGIDANSMVRGNQAFTLVTGEFSDKGQLMITQETRDDGSYTVVSGNVTGTNDADFKINIKGLHDLTASDFNL